MSASKTAIENFDRLIEKADLLIGTAEKFQINLFGPKPEATPASGSGGATPASISEGFFPYTFYKQEVLERKLYQAAEILGSINKNIVGDANSSPKEASLPKLKPYRTGTSLEGKLADHLQNELGGTL